MILLFKVTALHLVIKDAILPNQPIYTKFLTWILVVALLLLMPNFHKILQTTL